VNPLESLCLTVDTLGYAVEYSHDMLESMPSPSFYRLVLARVVREKRGIPFVQVSTVEEGDCDA